MVQDMGEVPNSHADPLQRSAAMQSSRSAAVALSAAKPSLRIGAIGATAQREWRGVLPAVTAEVADPVHWLLVFSPACKLLAKRRCCR